MMGVADRIRGVTGLVLDFDKVLTAGEQKAGYAVEVSFQPYAAFRTADALYVVCSEGVGAKVTDDDPYVLGLYKVVEGGFSLAPSLDARLSPADIEQLTTDTQIDLADLIRTFGGRLESNFWLWHKELTDEGPRPQDPGTAPQQRSATDPGEEELQAAPPAQAPEAGAGVTEAIGRES